MIEIPPAFLHNGDYLSPSSDEELIRRLAQCTMVSLKERHKLEDGESFVTSGMKPFTGVNADALWQTIQPEPKSKSAKKGSSTSKRPRAPAISNDSKSAKKARVAPSKKAPKRGPQRVVDLTKSRSDTSGPLVRSASGASSSTEGLAGDGGDGNEDMDADGEIDEN
jgi:hypothetical protein